jgi:RNA polymerase sigma-70 factor (ECF subfamily)
MTLCTKEPDLLAEYQAGDAQAFRRLVDLYRDRIVQFFYRHCLDRDRAEDLAQELFLKLLVRIGRYRPAGKMSVYIYRVATNLWIDHYRMAQPRPRFHSLDQVVASTGEPFLRPDPATSEAGPGAALEQREDLAVMHGALAALTPSHRQVLELAVFQQRPYAEIGEVLGIPVGTVKSRVHNAVAALKEMLGAANGFLRRCRPA